MTRKAAKAGPGAMVLVAIEQYVPEGTRIITDDLASRILPFSFRGEVRLIARFKGWIIRKPEEKVPGLWAGIMGRKRYIDDKVAADVGGQVEAAVIDGSPMTELRFLGVPFN